MHDGNKEVWRNLVQGHTSYYNSFDAGMRQNIYVTEWDENNIRKLMSGGIKTYVTDTDSFKLQTNVLYL